MNPIICASRPAGVHVPEACEDMHDYKVCKKEDEQQIKQFVSDVKAKGESNKV